MVTAEQLLMHMIGSYVEEVRTPAATREVEARRERHWRVLVEAVEFTYGLDGREAAHWLHTHVSTR